MGFNPNSSRKQQETVTIRSGPLPLSVSAPVLNIPFYLPWNVFIYIPSLRHFRKLFFWQFHLIMQVPANVFITAIHSLCCDTSLVVVAGGLAAQDSLRHGCVVSLFVVCHLGLNGGLVARLLSFKTLAGVFLKIKVSSV